MPGPDLRPKLAALIILPLLAVPGQGCETGVAEADELSACVSAAVLGCQMGGWLDEMTYKPEAPVYADSVPRLFHEVYLHVQDADGNPRVVMGELKSTAHMTSGEPLTRGPQTRLAWFSPAWSEVSWPVVLSNEPMDWAASYEPFVPVDQLEPDDFLQPGELTMKPPSSPEEFEAMVGPLPVW